MSDYCLLWMLQPLTTATTTATTYFKPLQLIVLVQAIHANVPPPGITTTIYE